MPKIEIVSEARARRPKREASRAAQCLERGRACFERHQWDDAFEALSAADALTPLAIEDLNRLAWSAGLTARDPEMLATLERAYILHLDTADLLAAARAAFWLGFRLFARNEVARASGWLGRAQRLVDRAGCECVEQGYLLLPLGQRHLNAGEFAEAHDAAARAAEFGDRFGEADLAAFARNLQGRVLLAAGQLENGFALLDEAMVAATQRSAWPGEIPVLPWIRRGAPSPSGKGSVRRTSPRVCGCCWRGRASRWVTSKGRDSSSNPGFDWIDLPVFGQDGTVQHKGGVVEQAPGLYFVGLTFLYAMSSSMIHGVSRDAARIVKVVAGRHAVGNKRMLLNT